jgi:thiol-disulfide isomerase/thioredoxin
MLERDNTLRRFITTFFLFTFILFTTPPALAEIKMSIGKKRDITMLEPPQFVPRMPFKGPKNNDINITYFKGNLVLLSFWNTGCAFCILELPSLDRLQETFADKNVMVVPVSINNARNMSGFERVSKTYAKNKIQNLDIYIDPVGEFASVMNIGELPTSILIDEQGREIGRIEGETDWMAIEFKNFMKYMISEMEYRKRQKLKSAQN